MEALREKYPGYFGAKLAAALPDGGFPVEFHVITACDPDGEPLPEGENEARTSAFREELLSLGWDYFPVTGYDPRPGATHREPGFGVVCAPGEAMRLGRKWGQVAVFHVAGGEVSLVFCSAGEERFLLRSWDEMTSA